MIYFASARVLLASNDKNISDIDYKPCKLLSQISIRTFLGAFLHPNGAADMAWGVANTAHSAANMVHGAATLTTFSSFLAIFLKASLK